MQYANQLVANESLVETAIRLRAWLISIGVICITGSVVLALVMDPVYRAETIVLPVSPEGDAGLLAGFANQLGALGSLAGLEMSADSSKEEALATLSSRSFTEEFIIERAIIQRLYEDEWNSERQAWKVPEDEIPTLWQAQKYFDEGIRSISENRRSGLVTIRIEWTDPEEAADWANDLVRRANDRLRQQAIGDAERSLDYLHRELEKTNILGIREAIFRLIETQTRKIMIANVREDYAFKIIDRAKAPDADDFVRPQRLLIVIGGGLLAVFIGLALILVVGTCMSLIRPSTSGKPG